MVSFIKSLLDIVGLLTTLFAVLLFFWSVACWVMGIYPLFYRLGFARWSRKITIVADDAMYSTIKSDLVDTGIFREKNISLVKSDSLAKIKQASLVLVHYQSLSEDQVKTLISYKKLNAGFIFYYPEFTPTAKIPDDIMKLINNEQFTTVVNLRGRLMNDIVATMLSTSYDKR